jgi:hypothetical protein
MENHRGNNNLRNRKQQNPMFNIWLLLKSTLGAYAASRQFGARFRMIVGGEGIMVPLE